MTDNHLPSGPFTYETTARPGEHDGKGHVYIVDGTGRKIASLWGPADTKLAMAAMIIEARQRQIDLSRPPTSKIDAVKQRRAITGEELRHAIAYVEAHPELWRAP